MMFNYKVKLLFCFVSFTLLFNFLSGTDLSMFQKEKTKLERKINSKKLGNYFRKMVMKKNNLIKNDIIFLENNDFSSLKTDEDINFSNMPNLDDSFEFKARLSALKWVKENYEKENFKPYGVSIDKEEIEGWKNYLILMIGNAGKHKLIKVCITNIIEDDFSIVLSYDKKCSRKIDILKKYNILKDMTFRDVENSKMIKKSPLPKKIEKLAKNIQTSVGIKHTVDSSNNKSLSEQLRNYQMKLAELTKQNELKSKNIEILKKQNEELNKIKTIRQRKSFINSQPKSFIEKNFEEASLLMKSKDDIINETPKPKKFFSLDSLSQKFSVDELKKIKSLIKFAKKNQIMDKIYSKNGEVTLNDLLNNNNVLLSLDKNSNFNVKDLLTSLLKNFTQDYHKEEDNMRKEIIGLKKVETEQQSKLQGYFGQMGENVNMIKNLMIFVKELSGEFQKSMLVFGNTLGSLSEKVKNVSGKMDKIEGKFIDLTKKIDIITNNSSNSSFKELSGDKKLNSHNELIKLIIQNSTKTILNEYQKNIKKEFKDTLSSTLSMIKNISNNLTNFIQINKKTENSANAKKEVKREEKKEKIIKKRENEKKTPYKNQIKKTNLRSIPKKAPTKKLPEKVIITDLGKDSLADEDDFDSIGPAPVKKPSPPKTKAAKDEFTDDFLEP